MKSASKRTERVHRSTLQCMLKEAHMIFEDLCDDGIFYRSHITYDAVFTAALSSLDRFCAEARKQPPSTYPWLDELAAECAHLQQDCVERFPEIADALAARLALVAIALGEDAS